MRNRSLIYYLLLILLLSGTGCEKYIPFVNAPVFEQKLVITSFISPSDTLSRIYVSSNQRLYGFTEQPEYPGDLTGTISDGTNEIELDTTSFGLSFSHDRMPVIPGKTYTLKVASSNGLYAEATATVPQQREILIKVDTTTRETDDYMTVSILALDIELTDYPGEKNFYNVIGKLTGYKSTSNQNSIKSIRYWCEYIDDKVASPDNRIKLESWEVPSLNNYDSAFIDIILLNTEESYYRYHKSLKNYDSGDNPFSEASPVYSNIEGGLGIFTSYTVDSLVFRLK